MTAPIIVGYQYPDANAAKAVFDRIQQTGRECSVYRTCTPDRTGWFVIGSFDTQDGYDAVDWQGGKEVALDDEQREWLLGRRAAAKVLVAVGVPVDKEVIHHDGGVTMPGGSG